MNFTIGVVVLIFVAIVDRNSRSISFVSFVMDEKDNMANFLFNLQVRVTLVLMIH